MPIQRRVSTRTAACAASLAFAFALSTPALADHAGPATLNASGGIDVSGPDTLAAGGLAVGLRWRLTSPDSRSDSELRALAAQHVHAHDSDYTMVASAGLAFGLTDRLTISAELPYIRRDDLRAAEHHHAGGASINTVVSLGTVSGIGDLTLLAKYRLTGAGSTGFAVIGGVKAPTGSTSETALDGERLETEHQPGSGSWDPVLGAAFATGSGPMRLSASALYQFATNGAQATRLGDRAVGGIALAHRFAPADHHDDADGDHHEAPHGHAFTDVFVELTGEHEGRMKVAGEIEDDSGGSAVWLSPGVRFGSASGFTLAGAIGIPVWQSIRPSHPENRVRATVTLGRSF